MTRVGASAAKPSLHEIAAMPFPHSQNAMREHYNKDWGRYSSDGDVRSFKVTVAYSWTESEEMEFEVEAANETEAEEIALDQFDDECIEDDAEVNHVKVVEQSS